MIRLEKLAEAHRNRVILEAEAESESIRLRGEAEAFAIEVKAKAESDQMMKKAEAWKEYKEAAMIDMVLDVLPKVYKYTLHIRHIFEIFIQKSIITGRGRSCKSSISNQEGNHDCQRNRRRWRG